MDLNKDSKDIYTIDAESYTQQRKDYPRESNNLLSFLINILLFLLAVVISFFLYQITKNNYSFDDVLNKEKIMATFNFSSDEKDKQTADIVIKEPMVKESAKPIKIEVVEKVVKEMVAKKETLKEKETIVKKETIKEKETVKEETIVKKETVPEIKKEIVVKKVEVLKEEKKTEPKVTIITPKKEKEKVEEDVLSTEYLNEMTKAMNGN